MIHAAVALFTFLAVLSGRRVRKAWFLPVITSVGIYPAFLLQLRHSILHGFAVLLVWAVAQTVSMLFVARRHPGEMEAVTWKGKEYTESMFRWIDTGVLPEGNATRVAGFHLKQTAIYCALALASANLLSLLLGSALLGYMNYYVARLSLRCSRPILACMLGWNPWSMVRVLAFLWLGVVLSLPLLDRFLALESRFSWKLLLPGFAGVCFDLLLKLACSNPWRKLLQRTMTGAAAR